ncbi:MAG: DUF4357 domain-containing protein [Clostridia bacterium]
MYTYCSKGFAILPAVIDKDGFLHEDVPCPSPSAAAVFVIGKTANGLIEWKTDGGITLKNYENTME